MNEPTTALGTGIARSHVPLGDIHILTITQLSLGPVIYI